MGIGHQREESWGHQSERGILEKPSEEGMSGTYHQREESWEHKVRERDVGNTHQIEG